MKNRKINKIILFGYMLVILYFMFFAFNRSNLYNINTYSYALTINEIPLWIPKSINYDWVFSMGNLLAFIPFGVLIPNEFDNRLSFSTCLVIFIISIFLLETTQMLTKLGSFDMGDILVNTMGFLIGYAALNYNSGKSHFKISRFVLHCVLLINITLVSSQVINTVVFNESVPQINITSNVN